MPNHCYNSFSVTGVSHEQWTQLAKCFQDVNQENQQDFLKIFCPEPNWLRIPNENGDLPLGPDDNQILHFPDGSQDTRWYDWRNEHWGTKWDVYSIFADWEIGRPSTEFNVNFYTAWSPLNQKCMATLSKQFPGALLINYYQEDGVDFCGITVAKDGISKDHLQTMSEHRQAFIGKKSPDLETRFEEEGLNLEDDLDEFFWDHCDLGEFSHFIRQAQEPLVEQMIHELGKATDCHQVST